MHCRQEQPSHLNGDRRPSSIVIFVVIVSWGDVLKREDEAGQPRQALERCLQARQRYCGGHLLQREVLRDMAAARSVDEPAMD